MEKLYQDIELFLEDRSVSGKQDSFREMFWKLVKSNKAANAAAGIAFVTLLLGVLALVGGMVNSTRLEGMGTGVGRFGLLNVSTVA